MIKKEIKYENFNGETVTEEFHFHLTKAELMTLNIESDGSLLSERLAAVEHTPEGAREVLWIFQRVVEASVGRLSEDGRRFIKNEVYTQDLLQTDAYSNLLIELVNNPSSAKEFLEGVLPKA